ncbi:MAG: 50S ribosomal protein L25, partial [Zoogloea sp.]|nr:50S ribosomal protein L25 [Zoogloea sp.]
MTIQFNAKKREVQGSSASRRLRRAGSVPAIVFGSGEPVQITVDHNEIYHALRNEAFHSSVLSMNLDGAVQSVILKDTQWHPYKQLVLHL